jgi:hypothetical protein
MLRLTSVLFILAVGALGPIGCVEVAGDQLGTAEQAVIECDEWICGSNSPVIATYRFHELNTNGLLNAEGFSVMSIWKAGTHYHLSVEQGRIVGRAGSLQISGAALQGAQIRLRQGAKTYAIQITALGSVQTFARLGGMTRPIETYQLDVAELVGDVPRTDFRSLCVNPPPRSSPDLLGMSQSHALVFEGERIDRTTKTIAPALDSTWFNIGCAGHAIAKLAANAQTEVARAAWGFNTTILDRQAFLKMLTADYCGTGKAFTVAGQPLQWRDWHGYTQYVSSPLNLELEARWTPNGATCLNTPRVDANPTQLGTILFGGNVMAEIAAECGALPPCAGGPTLFNGALVLSSNPI